MSIKKSTIEKINQLREKFYILSQGKTELIKILNQSEVSELVYDSNAIENSTLTLEETEKILLEIELDRYISQRELFEAKNLARVIEYIEEKSKNTSLDKEGILFLHKMLLSNIRDDIAGRFRVSGEWVKVGNHIVADPQNVEEEMDKILMEYSAKAGDHIVKKLARFHLSFENIHPFVDGNGRIGRVLNNYILLQEGFVPINIKFINRKEYYSAFREFDNWGKTQIMEEIITKALLQSYHKRISYLEGKKIILLSQYAKIKKISHSNLINKANRQTIPAFLDKGKWKIGI